MECCERLNTGHVMTAAHMNSNSSCDYPKQIRLLKKFQYGGGQLALPPLDEELLIAEGCDR